MKRYLKQFIHEDDGAEIIEYAIIIAVVALLAISILTVVNIARNKITQAGEMIEGIDVTGGASGENPGGGNSGGMNLNPGNGTGE